MALVGERSFAAIFQEVVGSIREIIRLEIQLAKVEVGQSLASAQHAVIVLVASVLTLLFAVEFLLLAAVHGLALLMPPWAAALTVAGATALFGGIGLLLAIPKFSQVGIPKRTIASLQETVS